MNLGQVRKWAMSGQKLGQIFEKPCECSRGHIFSLIILKLGQNVYHDEIPDEMEMGHVGQKLGH